MGQNLILVFHYGLLNGLEKIALRNLRSGALSSENDDTKYKR